MIILLPLNEDSTADIYLNSPSVSAFVRSIVDVAATQRRDRNIKLSVFCLLLLKHHRVKMSEPSEVNHTNSLPFKRRQCFC